ncbi:hypothetical protein F3D3_1640 [Fusibacter sp. 3D3]|nr:hypothetical protein F3D3_1640 [Fusibacter sp. 3D3]
MIIGITVFTLLMTGCQPKANDEVQNTNPSVPQETVQGTNPETEAISPEKVEASPIDKETEKEALMSLLKEGRMVEYKTVLTNYINDFDQTEIDALFVMHQAYLREHLTDEIDLYYSDDMAGIHAELIAALSDQASYIVYGSDKLKLVDKLQTESYKALVQKTLESGYALDSGEGSFYPQLDYSELLSVYEGHLSEQYRGYLSLMSEDLKQPLTTEEYLAVDLETLKARMYAYEDYLQTFGKQIKKDQPEMFEDIRIQLSVGIWNTVNPSLSNGLLGMDYYPTQELVHFYQSIIEDDQYPITTEAASRILKIIEDKREDVFGSAEKTELLYPMSQTISDDLNQKLKMAY